jgi:endogenous inhibitor of DNA gyrase (YacG/DUF329 family)
MSRGQCPICGKPPATEFRPFCSARCADVDLNRWLTGGYSIPDDAEDETDSEGGSDESRRPPED